MPKLAYFVFCEDIIPTKNSYNMQLFNPMIKLQLPFFPTLYSLNVAFAITGLDTNKKHCTLRIMVKAPSGETAFDSGEQFLWNEDNAEKKHAGLQMGGGIQNIAFSVAGEYTAEVYIDGRKIGHNELFVEEKKKASSNG